MKHNSFHPYFIVLFFSVTMLFSQTKEHPWQISFGFNAVDTFPTDVATQGDLFEDFFNVGDHWNVAPYPSQIGITNYIGSGFSFGLRFSHNTISKYGDLKADNDLFASGDAVIKYDINALLKTERFAPYLETGGGYVFFDEISAGYFNLGFGIEYALGQKKKTVLFAQSIFRNTGETYGNKHFQHSAGLGFRFGNNDQDNDGIKDAEDACPEEFGLAEFNGCPDSDNDGVQDSIDACPESPGLAELNGCPDRDGDGVEDRQDNCPDTKGLQSLMGCPDSDADGIRDSEDACPEVYGLEAFDGCPDSDNDGVEDAEDECPEVVGSITNNGCPEVDESVIEELNEIGQTIYFQTNSNKLSKNDKRILSRVYETLAAYQNYEIEVQGHTDSVGAEDLNMKLSKARAQAVADYLIFKGFSRNKISARGYGESKPAESNLTARGRSLNRRVVFKLIKNYWTSS